ncbi:reverse transcriptase domain, reverse transcriptase zinc-binding domain protein [Tanacetum coccineum]
MEKNDVLKPAIKSTPFESTNIASKIKNIEGKIRMPIRNVTFVQPLNDVTTTNLTLNGEFGKEGSANIGNPNSDNDVGVKRAELQQSVNSTMPTSRSSQVDSFANVVQHKVVKKVVQVKELRNSETVNGAAVAIPLDVVEEVSSRFANTLYGYFIGHRLAFPLVENYVKNTWAKFGLKRIQLHEEFFLFQFNTKEGMESVMEHGPWLIRRMPLMLNIWTPNTVLKKEEKAKVEWLKAGDSNTAYFHKIVKSFGAFVKHYNQFLGAEGVTNPLDDHDLFIRVLDNSKADCMVRDVTDDEIKSVMFSMGDDRAPCPDGFTDAFLKKA